MQVLGLCCALDSRPLLSDVCLDSGDEALALLGPSGAGKSLVLRCLLGLAPPWAQVRGELVLYKDGPRVALGDRQRLAALRGRGLTLLPQAAAASLDPVRTVDAQLRELLRLHDNREDTPASLLERVGLEVGLTQRHPHALSGGQRQRVALALALACRPAVLLADEPTAALDNLAQAELMQLLREVAAARAICVVLVSHDLALAAGLCQRAVVLDGGRVVEAGTMAALVASPVHSTTRALVASARRADALWGLAGAGARPGPEDMS